MIITVYKITITEAPQIDEIGDGFSLEPWGKQTREYKGYDDGGKKFILPPGFSIGRDGAGSLRIYDVKNLESPLVQAERAGSLYPAISDKWGITQKLAAA